MKAVALFVVFAGYTALVFGINHVRGGCVSFKDTVWPSSGTIVDPCANVAAGAAVGAATTSVGSTAVSGIGGLFTPKSSTPYTQPVTQSPTAAKTYGGSGPVGK